MHNTVISHFLTPQTDTDYVVRKLKAAIDMLAIYTTYGKLGCAYVERRYSTFAFAAILAICLFLLAVDLEVIGLTRLDRFALTIILAALSLPFAGRVGFYLWNENPVEEIKHNVFMLHQTRFRINDDIGNEYIPEARKVLIALKGAERDLLLALNNLVEAITPPAPKTDATPKKPTRYEEQTWEERVNHHLKLTDAVVKEAKNNH